MKIVAAYCDGDALRLLDLQCSLGFDLHGSFLHLVDRRSDRDFDLLVRA